MEIKIRKTCFIS